MAPTKVATPWQLRRVYARRISGGVAAEPEFVVLRTAIEQLAERRAADASEMLESDSDDDTESSEEDSGSEGEELEGSGGGVGDDRDDSD